MNNIIFNANNNLRGGGSMRFGRISCVGSSESIISPNNNNNKNSEHS